MKKLILLLAAFSLAIAANADFALAEYDQVAAVSNEVAAIRADLYRRISHGGGGHGRCHSARSGHLADLFPDGALPQARTLRL